jgi:peroxiredoxin
MLRIGQAAPKFCTRPVFGRDVDLEAWTRDKPLAISFVQHTNSPMARRALTLLQTSARDFDLADINILAVTPTSILIARDFVPRFHVIFPLIADADRVLFDLFEVPRAGRMQALRAFRPAMLVETARSLQEGFGPDPLTLEGQETQLPAEFVIAPGGEVVYAHCGAAITDMPDVEAILTAGRACRA